MTEELLKKRIVELEATVKKLEQDLIHDALTGLKTRAYFDQEARVYFDIAQNAGKDYRARRKKWFGFDEISFLFIDADYFKKINDTFGHMAGDEVLRAVAQTLQTSVREGDTASRWGGEEFSVSLVGASERDAWHKAEDIRRQVESIRFGKYPELKVTVSIGVASAERGHTFEEVMARADKALYAAKQGGRNKVVAYSEIAEL